jgi:hypothetical protein
MNVGDELPSGSANPTYMTAPSGHRQSCYPPIVRLRKPEQ